MTEVLGSQNCCDCRIKYAKHRRLLVVTMLMGRMSAAEYEAMRKQQADRELDIKPRPYAAKSNSDRTDWERVSKQLLNWLKS
jgi:hypothetical protein